MSDVMRINYRPLSEDEQSQLRALKEQALQFHAFITSLGSSRETSLALTKVEEAVMWATKNLTR